MSMLLDKLEELQKRINECRTLSNAIKENKTKEVNDECKTDSAKA